MGISEERLAEIADNLPPADADLSRRERDAHDLLAEVRRLREGIESLLNDPAAHETYEGGAHACVDVDDLNDLLNPTEGETDG